MVKLLFKESRLSKSGGRSSSVPTVTPSAPKRKYKRRTPFTKGELWNDRDRNNIRMFESRLAAGQTVGGLKRDDTRTARRVFPTIASFTRQPAEVRRKSDVRGYDTLNGSSYGYDYKHWYNKRLKSSRASAAKYRATHKTGKYKNVTKRRK